MNSLGKKKGTKANLTVIFKQKKYFNKKGILTFSVGRLCTM